MEKGREGVTLMMAPSKEEGEETAAWQVVAGCRQWGVGVSTFWLLPKLGFLLQMSFPLQMVPRVQALHPFLVSHIQDEVALG